MAALLSSVFSRNTKLHACAVPILRRAVRSSSGVFPVKASLPAARLWDLGSIRRGAAVIRGLADLTTGSTGSPSTPGTWPLQAKWNDNWHPEVDILLEQGGRQELVPFVVDTGTPFTTLCAETFQRLGLPRAVSPVRVHGVNLKVGLNGHPTANLLGTDFFISINGRIVADYTGDDVTDWKLKVAKGHEPFTPYSIEEDEVPAVKPELQAFQACMVDDGWAWVSFPVEANGKTSNSCFVIDTGSPGTLMSDAELAVLGFTKEEIREAYTSYEDGINVKIAGVSTVVLASGEDGSESLPNPSVAGQTILGTTFFTDARAIIKLDYKARTVEIN